MTPAEIRREFRAKVSETLSVFSVYGMDVYIPGAFKSIQEAAEDMHRKLNEGKEVD